MYFRWTPVSFWNGITELSQKNYCQEAMYQNIVTLMLPPPHSYKFQVKSIDRIILLRPEPERKAYKKENTINLWLFT